MSDSSACWDVKPLRDLCEVISGGTPSREIVAYWQPQAVHWATPTDITKDKNRLLTDTKEKISLLGLQCSAARMLPKNTILMTARATIGAMKVTTIDCCTNQGFKSLVPKSHVNIWYLYYQMLRRKADYTLLGTGSTFLEVNKQDTEAFELALPPLPEQQKIAKILTTVDNLIDKTQALIDKYNAVKQGMMTDLFTRGIDLSGCADKNPNYGQLRPSFEEAPEFYEKTKFGPVPKGWVISTANELCDIVIDCKNRTPPVTSAGYGVIKTSNIKVGKLLVDTLTYTDKQSYDLWTQRGTPTIGDVVITREAPVGESFLIEEDMPTMCLGQRVMLYRPNKKQINPRFMYYSTRYEAMQKRLLDMAGGSTVGHVRVGDIRDLEFIVPETEEQNKIVVKLSVLDKRRDSELSYLNKLKQQKKGLMQDLLTGKVRVN